jgi:hypothetical protein
VNRIEKNANLARSCATYGFVIVITEFLFYWCALACFIELWLRVVLSVKIIKNYRYFYLFGGLALTLVNLIIILADKDYLMVDIGGSECNWNISDTAIFYWHRGLPHTIYFAIGILLALHVLYTCVKISMSIGNHIPYASV